MSLEDALNERRSIARRLADEDAARAVSESADRDWGRAQLRHLFDEAYAFLDREGAPLAVEYEVTKKHALFGGWKYVASGYPVGYAAAGGAIIFMDDGTVRHRAGAGANRLQWDHEAANAATQAFQRGYPGAVFLQVGKEISWSMIRPTGWDEGFFVEGRKLLWATGESGWAQPAEKKIAEWLVEVNGGI